MTPLGPRAGGLRLIRIVLIAVAIGVVINTFGTVYLYLHNQSSHRQVTQALCTLRGDDRLNPETVRALSMLDCEHAK